MANYLFFLFLIIIVFQGLGAEGYTYADGCNITRCGENGPPIRFPFRLKPNQPECCGCPGFELSCNGMNQTVIELPVGIKLVVNEIHYKSQAIRVHDPNNCFPALLPSLNLSASPFIDTGRYSSDYALFNCSPAERNIPTFVSCLSGPGYNVYAVGDYRSLSDELTYCVKIGNFSSIPPDFFEDQQTDFSLRWQKPNCRECEAKGASKKFRLTAAVKKRLFTVLGGVLIALVVIALYLIYTSLKRKKEDQVKVESFLEDYKALKPSRYSFADIKKITNNFKDKLGEGAYGTVFKGKLSTEIFVAVKVIESSMENGEEFINEVATMGRIHHINVVRLVGFCADGIRRALVYEFLPNESLEKFIFPKTQKKTFLGWEKLQDIALGIAKGIEYLHQGCDRQILHFDIKPHNILLDHNFNPKIADFGLAKLFPKDQSKVSMTAARGTMGYIAPEVFSKNFGNVSYKSDVYSFGMLLLEMVGGRKNIDLTVQNTSQTYFPEWIYDRLNRGEGLGIKIEVEEHTQIAKKLTIVGLCCIQWSPIDRPSMKTVVQMLEGKVDALAMPPDPFASIGRNMSSNRPARAINRELDVISEV